MLARRTFIRRVLSSAMVAPLLAPVRAAAAAPQVLYNGIRLGEPWPPRQRSLTTHPVAPPYLRNPPAVIPIDVGRQLFIDDFLIEDTSLVRTWHRAEYHPNNPVLTPTTPWEKRDPVAERTNRPINPAAMVFSDGVFYDSRAGVFKMWYMAGYGLYTCLATSTDGVHWTRPIFDVVKNTNVVNTETRDSSTVWLDPTDPDPRRRYKMSIWYDHALLLFVSPDGVHWTKLGKTGRAFDRSTFFYNPFRKVWVFSLRGAEPPSRRGEFRHRLYWETSHWGAATWTQDEPVLWVGADALDPTSAGMTTPAELYNLDCAGYESVMLGLFSIWRGEYDAREKINELTVGFSRDGFHWSRDERGPFIGVSNTAGSWNWANIQSAGGCCAIVGDRLHFYVSARQGVPGTNLPGVCSTGLATLRRDGFASMDWRRDDTRPRRIPASRLEGGYLTTRAVSFSGKHLFVNAEVGGELRAEVLDPGGRVIEPFSRANAIAMRGNSTRTELRWNGGWLGDLAGRPVRLRFWLSEGRLYSFWVSPWPTGESRGAIAGGGPGLSGLFDERS